MFVQVHTDEMIGKRRDWKDKSVLRLAVSWEKTITVFLDDTAAIPGTLTLTQPSVMFFSHKRM